MYSNETLHLAEGFYSPRKNVVEIEQNNPP